MWSFQIFSKKTKSHYDVWYEAIFTMKTNFYASEYLFSINSKHQFKGIKVTQRCFLFLKTNVFCDVVYAKENHGNLVPFITKDTGETYNDYVCKAPAIWGCFNISGYMVHSNFKQGSKIYARPKWGLDQVSHIKQFKGFSSATQCIDDIVRMKCRHVF